MSSCVSFKTEEIFDNGIMGQLGGDYDDCPWIPLWMILICFMVIAFIVGYYVYKAYNPILPPPTQEHA